MPRLDVLRRRSSTVVLVAAFADVLLTDAFELADEEVVQGHQITRVGGEVTEPERPLECVLGDQLARRCGQLRKRGDSLATSPQPTAVEDLLRPLPRQLEPEFGEHIRVAARTQGRAYDGFGQELLRRSGGPPPDAE